MTAATLRASALRCEGRCHWDLAAHFWRRAANEIAKLPGEMAALDVERLRARADDCERTARSLDVDRPKPSPRVLLGDDPEAWADQLFGGEYARRRAEEKERY